jgi:hypothetical protein
MRDDDHQQTGTRAPRSGLRPLDPHLASVMIQVARGQTDEVLGEQFGLSYNSWRKIKAGLPIRRSLAERIEQRVKALACTDMS